MPLQPITTDWAVWPIRAQSARTVERRGLGIVSDSLRNEVMCNIHYEKIKVFGVM